MSEFPQAASKEVDKAEAVDKVGCVLLRVSKGSQNPKPLNP